jgi:hypothetical protein
MIKEREGKTMELRETIEMMNSADYKERKICLKK